MNSIEQEGLELIASLEADLQNASSSKLRLEILVSLVGKCFHYRQLAKTKAYVVKALILARRLNSLKDEAFLYYIAGANLIRLSQNSEALDNLMHALKISQRLGNNGLLSKIVDAVGYLYALIGDYERALEYFLESVSYEEDNIVSLNNAGFIYSRSQQHELALEYLWKGHNIAKANEITEVALTTLVNIATNNFSLGNFDAAKEHFTEALEQARKQGFYSHVVFACSGLSKVSRVQDDLKGAKQYLRQAVKEVQKITDDNSRQECYGTITNSYEDMGDYRNAYKYIRMFLELKRKNQSEEITQKLSSIHANFEIEKHDLEAMRMIEKSSRLATIGIIAESITKDMGNPLHAIKVSADSIWYWNQSNEGYLPEIILRAVQSISASSYRIDDIIKHMKDFWASPQNDGDDFFDLNEAIDKALLLIATRIENHGIRLKSNTATGSLKVKGSPIYFEQIVINLIFNSIQALDRIDLAEKEICISSDRKGGEVFIEVQDNGPGVSEELKDLIYEPFYTTKEKHENMGLGLAIVRQIVARFGGRITHNNLPGGGVRFVTSIPLAEE